MTGVYIGMELDAHRRAAIGELIVIIQVIKLALNEYLGNYLYFN